ncbi:Gfo/Idh/MocA family oxidoreductase [uncultured Paracoccus sp.]|uniref:Gfo/Idh/MocA family protein n=1 Tax=uncultured Paracoccus sp. TaxID=189685 RepID=UPI002631AD97|nr:Gfo/Idh/MocA family oxidoreductase [uncultured Paracoccus sp.]
MAPQVSRIAIVGAGVIGRMHAKAIAMAPGVTLAAIVDPSPEAQAVAAEFAVPLHASLESLIDAGGIDGVILATPNQLHAPGALTCIAAGLPVLVEKPLAGDLAGARAILAAADAADVAVATGHHRRHNPLIVRAKALIDEGALGQIAAIHGSTWFLKPDAYFEADWRRKPGAGPVYLNLIHDIDLMMHFCGPVARLQAMTTNAIRGFEVEDTSVVSLQFRSGALGTITVSDTVPAPWSWELTARENPAYPATGQDCYWIAGTEGSLALPSLTLWRQPGWHEAISATRFPFDFADPLVLQAAQFGRVVRGEAPPLVSAHDGLAALEVVEAVRQAAASGRMVVPGEV